ncbi:TPA: bacteriocin [Vibrio metschnikovii]|uniref:bacteriocin n=1 Tax=Vibrio TaxID=662 RepID=UPI00137336B3|nr:MULTISPECIES: bacteriocin [Vibrio]EKO3628980.1 bacteriocin [Vibrio metschnikovii]EKO3632416.1 bacteriocin [Vibrio metschnikovii]NAW60486.1 bacteriocin [Vibrio sp. V31_P5A7T61]NAW78238.1 bacteriocin [Vibrio sp. V33_P6A3T137]NAX01994.1 bacteriocin [Vibrio sp. V34_P3A8T189]
MSNYSLLSLAQGTKNNALMGLRDAANNEERRNQTNQQLKQAHKQQTLGNAATGAGIGMMAGGPVGAAVGAGVGLVLGGLF